MSAEGRSEYIFFSFWRKEPFNKEKVEVPDEIFFSSLLQFLSCISSARDARTRFEVSELLLFFVRNFSQKFVRLSNNWNTGLPVSDVVRPREVVD